MNLKIFRNIAGDVRAPVMLAGWPGMGRVGVGAIDYLRKQLKAVPFAQVDASEYFTPEAVEVEHGIAKFPALPSHLFSYVQDPELIIFESEAQIAGGGGVALMEQLLELAQKLKVETVYTGAAFAMPISYREPVQVWGVANHPALRDRLAPYGVRIMQEGQITGMNGLLLGFAGLREIRAACLLASMPQYAVNLPNPKASREIVRIMGQLLGLRVEMAEIDSMVAQMDRIMAEIEERIQTAFTHREEGEEQELEEVDEEKVPQYVMERIERLFAELQVERSQEKAVTLKKELDRWNLYSLYEDRFLNLFRRGKEGGV
jgi:uncharacterized protein